MGPTASGKTDLAIALCQQLPCEIISVDSALIYRGMDIGTAKPTAAELAKAPHRLIDICDPAESYSAARFRRDALSQMAEISAAGKVPLLVGGTMLYFKALLQGLASMPAADPQVRQAIEQDAKHHGWPYVHQQLAAVDPESAARIHPNHSQRIERALEVFRVSGVTMTEMHRQQSLQRPTHHFTQLAIAPLERSVLHERIARRFNVMMEQGLIDEVIALRRRGDLHPDLPSMRSVGYRQVWQFLDGELDRREMIERGIIATRQLAKRQMTWLRSWPDLCWMYTDSNGALVAANPGSDGVFGNSGIDREFIGRPPLALAQKYLAGVSAFAC